MYVYIEVQLKFVFKLYKHKDHIVFNICLAMDSTLMREQARSALQARPQLPWEVGNMRFIFGPPGELPWLQPGWNWWCGPLLTATCSGRRRVTRSP